MKKCLFFTIILFSQFVRAQFCSNPNPNFCSGNFFTNGDFEIISGNPDAVLDQDINLATGWQAPWGAGSLADLACSSRALGSQTPNPSSGVYAGMWIINSNNPNENDTYREGMYNRLTTSIPKSTGSYSFSFSLASGMIVANNRTVTIGIYGVYNPNNVQGTDPTGLFAPTIYNLWSGNSAIQVVKLGTITTSPNQTNTWTNQNISFDSNSTSFPANGITHILVTSDDVVSNTWNKEFMYFDNFCLTKTEPRSVTQCDCIPPALYSEDLTTSLFISQIISGNIASFTYNLKFTPNQNFANLNNAWNNWINTAFGFPASQSSLVVHQFTLYEYTSDSNGNITSETQKDEFWSSSPYFPTNTIEFNYACENNKKYYIKHGVYYGRRDNGKSPLSEACPWKETRFYIQTASGPSPMLLLKTQNGSLLKESSFKSIEKLRNLKK